MLWPSEGHGIPDQTGWPAMF